MEGVSVKIKQTIKGVFGPEPSEMEQNRSAPRANSCVRLWNGTEPSGSSKGNILPICGMHPFHRIGGMWWNGSYLAAINYKALH